MRMVRSDVQPPNDFSGWSGSRTCNHTVISDRIRVGYADFPTSLLKIDRIRCVSATSFLVRNWCAKQPSGAEGIRDALRGRM